MQNQISDIFCKAQPCDLVTAPFPRRYRLLQPAAKGRGSKSQLSPVVEVRSKPSSGAAKVGTIPRLEEQWEASYIVIAVDRETWVKDTLWVRLANPWIFNAKVTGTPAPRLK